MARSLIGLLAGATLIACADRPTAPLPSPSAQRSTAVMGEQRVDTSEYVITPNGYYHRSCVYEIPAGARFGKNGVVTRADHSTYQVPTCIHPGPVALISGAPRPPAAGAGGATGDSLVPPGYNGWAVYGYAFTSGTTLRHLSAALQES